MIHPASMALKQEGGAETEADTPAGRASAVHAIFRHTPRPAPPSPPEVIDCSSLLETGLCVLFFLLRGAVSLLRHLPQLILGRAPAEADALGAVAIEADRRFQFPGDVVVVVPPRMWHRLKRAAPVIALLFIIRAIKLKLAD